MSIVENLVNQISTKGLGGITKPFGFDMEDDTFAKLLEGLEIDKSYKVSFKYFMPETSVPAGSGDSLFYQTGIVSKDAPLSNSGYPTAPLKKGDPSYGKLGEWQEYSITFTNWDDYEKYFKYAEDILKEPERIMYPEITEEETVENYDELLMEQGEEALSKQKVNNKFEEIID